MEIPRDPRPHHIQIDKTDMSTHPDLVLQLVFGKIKQRKKIGVVLEVCTLLPLIRITKAPS